ncbi:MAG: UDP-N-acetylmuramoyl-L-alanyl-D-glutamate--2,6-diaminopimelate ligase [Atopobiaceae bacterium]|nr:UDP-N-acetylmuramoyl-L-alanyl-D-glutamate--2,6-diaminopimelate ligase [Atopobiaceae bacterium]
MDTSSIQALGQLLAEKGLLSHTANLPEQPIAVHGADSDSRVVRPGNIFVCKGVAFKAAYLTSALEKGAVGYLCDVSHAPALDEAAPGVPALVTTDEGFREAMGLVACAAWGQPDLELPILGITGTKGKSTCAYMVRAIVDAACGDGRCGVMGSIDMYDGIENIESVNTTPESPDLWRHVANARDSKLAAIAMEVSSHGLKYNRVDGLHLAAGAFLNLGRDHISAAEHPDFEDYFASKLRIFEHTQVGIVNLETDRAPEVLAAAQRCERVVCFAASGHEVAAGTADVWASDVHPALGSVSFVAHTPAWTGPVTISMPGLFNVDNALAAIALVAELGIGEEAVREGLAHVRVPGRMELIPTFDPKVIGLVDYAHNKLSYQRFFSSVAEEFPGMAVIALFGAPGCKAYERRVELPQEAAKWSDVLIYTEEDPAYDPVEEICAQMAEATPAGARYEVICDREEAIARSVELAFEFEQGAVVCLLAKGDETRQHRGSEFVPVESDPVLFERYVAQAQERVGA